EEIAEGVERRGVDVADLLAPVVRGLVDDRESERVEEVLVVELRERDDLLVRPERQTEREGAVRVIVVALLVGEGSGGIALAGIGLELWTGERARQVLEAPHESEIEAGAHPLTEVPAGAGVEAVALLLGVLAIALEAHDGRATVDVERPVHLAGRDVLL